MKRKGTNAERELFHMFWQNGWACSRVAGSGSNRYPSPDLIAGNGSRLLAIECKATKFDKKYIPSEDVDALIEYSKKLGAEVWLGIRFKTWYFVNIEDVIRTEKSCLITKELVDMKGLLFEELIGKTI